MDVYTSSECAIKADGFSTEARYRLAAGSTCLAIAMLAGQDEVVKYITNFLEEHEDERDALVGHTDKEGNTTYQIACMCNTEQAHEYLKNPMYVDAELFLVSEGDATAIMNGAYFGRPETCKILAELAENEKYQKELYTMTLRRDSYNCNCMEVALQEVDYKKFSTTEEMKHECYQVLRELCMKAYKFAEEDEDLADVLETFKGDATDFDDVFDESRYESKENKRNNDDEEAGEEAAEEGEEVAEEQEEQAEAEQ